MKYYVLFLCASGPLYSTEPAVSRCAFPHPSESKSGELVDLSFKRKVKLSPQIEVEMSVDYTNKGNGRLSVNGASVHIYDDHDDGVTFAGGYKAVYFLDLNGDKILDLLVSGMENNRDTGDVETKTRFVTNIYLFDPETNSFKMPHDQ